VKIFVDGVILPQPARLPAFALRRAVFDGPTLRSQSDAAAITRLKALRAAQILGAGLRVSAAEALPCRPERSK
jgi:hypothetical protein